MFATRTIGKVLRGKATTPQVAIAAVLGSTLGFVPGFILPGDLGGGFLQAPGLILGLLVAVLVLNANMAVFGICLATAKLLSLALLPMSFQLGRVLLDGPTAPIFEMLINAPVFAWFGLDHYATAGGVTMGLALGVMAAFLLARSLRKFRSVMAGFEEGSERFQKMSGKRSVKIATWLFVGGNKGKKSYRDILDSQRKGLPVRLTGIVAVAVLGAGLWFSQSFLTGPAFQRAVQNGLQDWNGATVDVAGASLDLAGAQILLSGLAIADPQALERDQFRSDELSMDLDMTGLLSRRLVIDKLSSVHTSTGKPRETQGQLVRSPEPIRKPAETTDRKAGVDIDHYIAEAEKWKGRLQQVSKWLDRLSSDEGPEGEASVAAEQRIEQDIEQQIREYGLAKVVAKHRIKGAPLVLVRELVFDGVTAEGLEGDLLDIRAHNVSSNPGLVREPMQLSILAKSGKFGFHFRFDSAEAGSAQTVFFFKDLPVDTLASQWKGDAPIRGGMIDVELKGRLDCSRHGGPWVNLPLHVTLRDTNLRLKGMRETNIPHLKIPLDLQGPLESPRVRVDDEALASALVEAGKRELADEVQRRAGELLDEHLPDVSNELKGVLQGATPPGAAIDETKRKAEAEAERARKKAEEEAEKAKQEAKRKAAEELKKKLPGGIGGLFGGKK